MKNNVLIRGMGRSSSIISAVLTINIAVFLVSILIDFRPANQLHFSPFHFLSPSDRSLLFLGSTGTIPIFELGRWWTLVSANWLHGGLLHLLFNMLALRQLAPLVIEEFGPYRTVSIYILGGCLGFLVSAFAGVQFTIGASASLCALIGAMLYYGKSRGGNYGQAVFSEIGGWALGIAIFGFFFPGINNWGHGGGMAAGALLAMLFGYRERKKESMADKSIALLSLTVTLLVLLWMAINALALLVL